MWEIYDHYHVQMYHIVKKYVKDSNLANEAVQDIFVKLWEKKDRMVYKGRHDIVKQGMQERSRRKREVFEL